MRKISLVLVFALAVSLAMAGDKPKVVGHGNWGKEIQGIACRITTDKTDYNIGDKVFTLVEIKNMTDGPIALGLEPLLEVSKGTLVRQPVEVHTHFTQQHQGTLGYFCTTVAPFPSGTKTEAKIVIIKPGEVYSEVVTRTPWGPSYGCSPSEAQPGRMGLSVTLHQFLTGDLKKTSIKSNEVELTIRRKPEDSNKSMEHDKFSRKEIQDFFYLITFICSSQVSSSSSSINA